MSFQADNIDNRKDVAMVKFDDKDFKQSDSIVNSSVPPLKATIVSSTAAVVISRDSIEDVAKSSVEIQQTTTTVTSLLKTSSGLGDLLLQHSEIGDWCDVVDKQIDEIGYELSESKKPVASSVVTQAPPPLFFSPPFYTFISKVNYSATRSDIFYFFGGSDKVQHVHMYEHQNHFNGNCLIELKNFKSFIEALNMDDQELMGRSISVEHYDSIKRTRKRYSYQQLDNAREGAIRRKEGGRPQYQNRSSMDGQWDNRRSSNRHSMHSDYAGSQHSLSSAAQPMRMGGQMLSNDVRSTQMQNTYGAQANSAASQFHRASMRGSQQFQRGGGYSHHHQPRNWQHDERPSSIPSQPLAETKQQQQPIKTPKPAHVDIYGRGKPADTSNKLLEIQEKLDEEERLQQQQQKKAKSAASVHHDVEGTYEVPISHNQQYTLLYHNNHHGHSRTQEQQLLPLSAQSPVFPVQPGDRPLPLLGERFTHPLSHGNSRIGGSSQRLQTEKRSEIATPNVEGHDNHNQVDQSPFYTSRSHSQRVSDVSSTTTSSQPSHRQFSNQTRRIGPNSGANTQIRPERRDDRRENVGNVGKQSQDDNAHRKARPSVSKDGIAVIARYVNSSTTSGSPRNSDKSISNTTIDYNTGVAAVVSEKDGRLQKSFSRESQKSSKRGSARGPQPLRTYTNKKSLSHQFSTHSNTSVVELPNKQQFAPPPDGQNVAADKGVEFVKKSVSDVAGDSHTENSISNRGGRAHKSFSRDSQKSVNKAAAPTRNSSARVFLNKKVNSNQLFTNSNVTDNVTLPQSAKQSFPAENATTKGIDEKPAPVSEQKEPLPQKRDEQICPGSVNFAETSPVQVEVQKQSDEGAQLPPTAITSSATDTKSRKSPKKDKKKNLKSQESASQWSKNKYDVLQYADT